LLFVVLYFGSLNQHGWTMPQRKAVYAGVRRYFVELRFQRDAKRAGRFFGLEELPSDTRANGVFPVVCKV
jgi:hypothetical protein